MAGMADLPLAQDWLGRDLPCWSARSPSTMELSVICARDAGGAIAFYDLPQNIHRGGILREASCPRPIPDEVASHAAIMQAGSPRRSTMSA